MGFIQAIYPRSYQEESCKGSHLGRQSYERFREAIQGSILRTLLKGIKEGNYPGGLSRGPVEEGYFGKLPDGGYPGGLPKDAILEDYLRILFRVCQLAYCFHDGS